MNAAARTRGTTQIVFRDALGERLRAGKSQAPGGQGRPHGIEFLLFHEALASVPSFEFALRERLDRLAGFHDVYFARALGVDRLPGSPPRLMLVSRATPGRRLSELLASPARQGHPVNCATALLLIQNLLQAVALLHESGGDLAHGAIAPERIVITPTGELVLVEHVLGPALEQLQYARERYWSELGIPLPPSRGPRLDRRADVLQSALVTLALLLGRRLETDEYPRRIDALIAEAFVAHGRNGTDRVPGALRKWLERVFQNDMRQAPASGLEAWLTLESALSARPTITPPPRGARPEVINNSPPVARGAAARTPRVTTAPTLCLEGSDPLAPRALALDGPRSDDSPVAVYVRRTQYVVRRGAEIVEGVSEAVTWGLHRVTRAPASLSSNNLRALALITPPTFRHAPVLRLRERLQQPVWRRGMAAAGVLALVGVTMLGGQQNPASAHGAGDGTLLLHSNPPGARVVIGETARGTTPLTLTLPTGDHLVELHGPGAPRTVPVTIRAGGDVSHYVDLPQRSSAWGQLEVRSEPPGAQVTIDGLSLGATPMIVDLAPGEHTIALTAGNETVRQSITVKPAITTALLVPLRRGSAAPLVGWLAVDAPVDLQVYQDGRLLGQSANGTITLPAGRHTIELVNEVLGYRATRRVNVVAGRTAPLEVEFPNGLLSLDATPWAEVWIDGERAGQTPLVNHPVPIGPHEILFRHPELGQQIHAVSIKLDTPSQISVDLTRR
jgi:hypothetical protein